MDKTIMQSSPAVQLTEQQGAVVVCEQGQLWLTDNGDDVFLEHGQSYRIQADEPVVIESLRGNSVFHVENMHQHDYSGWGKKLAKALHNMMHGPSM
ncbi:Protein of unknown function [Formivibrio citricus]|uniref:DUF2917 domain-containing protein n=1 Tax=Formivibrio citricus TaxID=83765 RepID=A0A1I4Y688_9NEIS|nr:DUF2917 domain-containing protein [Formivibrio citricus]SFN33233.1 Protein of unknown function [Formivibrio citricus]